MKQKCVLFLHPNFPAQFRHLTLAAASNGHDTRFLCQTHYGRKLPGVKRLTLQGNSGNEYLNKKGGTQLKRSAIRAIQYRNGLVKLRDSGWNPDLVISHSGWGCGLNVKEIWPNCRHIAYLEWWFNPSSDFFKYDPHNTNLQISSNKASKYWPRNQSVALELICADAIVAPTNWQAKQLPTMLRDNCLVIHDGIDIQKYKPGSGKLERLQPTVTYGTRGMESMRGFPQFIESLVILLGRNPSMRAQIAGEDKICYGGRSPKKHSSWGLWAKSKLSKAKLSDRVDWLGRLDQNDYVTWLQKSSCHVYLTHPFVASWSLLEAISCNCPLVVSDVEPVRELCEKAKVTVNYVDHRNSAGLAAAMEMTVATSISNPTGRDYPDMSSYSTVHSLKEWSRVAGLQLTTDD